jgi:hypothetical protein
VDRSRVIAVGDLEICDRLLLKTKCGVVFNLVLDHASQGRKWAA